MAVRNGILESLERRRPTLFFLGGAMFVVSAALNGMQIVAGTERLSLTVGEAFIAGGWIAGLLGLLGLYPGLADRSRWLSRAGAVFAVIGVLAFVVLAVVSLYGFVAGSEPGTFPIPIVYFIPGVFVGSLLAFVSFSGATLQSDDHPRALSIFLLVPSAIFVTNLFILPAIFGTGRRPPEVLLVIVGGLALAMLVIGYLLRTGPKGPDRPEPAPAEVQHD
jgi:hypothetical protein